MEYNKPSLRRYNFLKKLSALNFLISSILLVLCSDLYAQSDNFYNANKLVQTELVFDREIIQFHGSENLDAPRIGVLFKIEKGWHIYWKNSGESGKATSVKFKLPPLWNATELSWPTPVRYIEKGDIKTYAYSDEVLLFSDLKLPPIVPNQDEELEFSAEVHFLVCNDRCIPGKTTISKSMLISSVRPEIPSKEFPLFKKHQSLTPKVITHNTLIPHVVKSISYDSEKSALTLEFPAPVTKANLFETNSNFLTTTSHVKTKEGALSLTNVFDIQDAKDTLLSAVIVVEENGGELSYEFKNFDINDISKKAFHEAEYKNNTYLTHSDEVHTETTITTKNNSSKSLIFYLLTALLGGIILNFMPCVLPVLSIKFFGLVNAKHKCRSENIRDSLFFSLGVISSFMALACVFSFIKVSGQSLGWGFQFQNPYFIYGMIIFLFFMALSFFDLLKLPTVDCSSLEETCNKTKHADLKNFLDGILISVLSTPCTAPFMGTAVAFALSQTTFILFAVFFFLALGLCLPYVLISTNQKLLSYMPKPGAWMQDLKHLMGFGLIATIIWLVSVLGNIVPGSVLCTLMSLFVAGFCVWVFRLTKSFSLLSRVILLGLLAGLSLVATLSYFDSSKHTDNKLEWIPFTEQVLNETGPIFIDFTADWCITCKFNDNFVIDTSEIRALVKEKNIKMIKADWTSGDEKMTSIIKRFGAEGVPLYVFIDSNGNKKVLNTILTKEYLKDALKFKEEKQ